MKKRGIAGLLALALVLALAGSAAAESWTCPTCGLTNTGNFCPNCGTAATSINWTCTTCGQANSGNFCSNCGSQRPGASPTTQPSSSVDNTLEQISGETDKVKVCVSEVDASDYIVSSEESTRWLPDNVNDGDESTCWQFSAKSGLKDKWLTLYTEAGHRVDEIWIKNGFWGVSTGNKDQNVINAKPQKIKIEYLYSGEDAWRDAKQYTLKDDRKNWQVIQTGHTEKVDAIRISILSIIKGSVYKTDVCMSEVMLVQKAPASSAKEAQATPTPRVYESRPDVSGVSLKMKIATRTGPNTKYTDSGTFFGSNWKTATVKVLKKATGNGVWWVQVDFDYGSMGKFRVWTGLKRVDVDLNKVKEEGTLGSGYVGATTETYFGPGGNYAKASKKLTIKEEAEMIIYGRENGYLDIEYWYTMDIGKVYRIWVPESACYGIHWGNDNSGEN